MQQRSSPAQELAELLHELKSRSNLSYQQLARKTFTSSSTLHRYCSGAGIPPDYEMLARIAQACGAGPAEQAELLRCWTALTSNPPPASPSIETTETTSRAENAPEESSLRPARSPTLTRILGRRGLIIAAVAMLVVLTVVVSYAVTKTNVPTDAGGVMSQEITGPAWDIEPQPVPSAFFGVTMNSTSGVMPSFRVGSVRFWDSETRWANLQPERGQFSWSTLDRLVAGANQAGLSALFVLGGTPAWAAPNGPKTAYPDNSRTAPPDNLADWDTFVRAVVQRYHGRLEAYELWDMGNDPRFFSGSLETLVEMTRRASQIIRSIDSRATVVCPSMGQLWEKQAQQKLQRFAELGGYQYCDVAGVKLYPRHASNPPESMLELISTVDRIFHHSGNQPPLWDTGTNYDVPLEQPLNDEQASNYAVRFFLTGLYAHVFNVQRMYFYSWGSARVPLVLQPNGGAPTQAALNIEQLQDWFDHASIRSCGHGLALQLPPNVWQCTFTITPPDSRPRLAKIRWTDHDTATTAAGTQALTVRHLIGNNTDNTDTTDTVTVSESPILITYQEK